jgi:hypothetical protein
MPPVVFGPRARGCDARVSLTLGLVFELFGRGGERTTEVRRENVL